MNRWDKPQYQRIQAVTYIEDKFKVCFEDGDVVEIKKDSITPLNSEQVEWNKFTFTEFEIVIPAKPSEITVPWDKIRVLSDNEFAKHLASAAEEHAKLIGVKVRRLRERSNVKSADLADRAGVTPQTISRIEKGHTDVNFATLRKILAAMGYSLKDLADEDTAIIEKDKNSTKDYFALAKKLARIGIDNNLLKKIIPNKVYAALLDKNSNSELLYDEAARYLGRIFSWKNEEIWQIDDLSISNRIANIAFFKTPLNGNLNQIVAYSHYAYYLANALTKITPTVSKHHFPGDIEEFKTNFYQKHSSLTFENLLIYTWDLGITVLPLSDSGVFHGACWNIEGKYAIILKQKTLSHARWTFDLLHELYHVFAHLDEPNSSVIETEELTPFINNESDEELEANAFANQVIFGNRAEELAISCIQEADFKLELLKPAVSKVAKVENIRADFLANYIAFRLQLQGQNWWGTASNMQITEPSPLTIAIDTLRNKIPIEKLNSIDLNLINTALSN